jgi:hypothetical protein
VASQQELCSTAASAAAARRKNEVENIPDFADMTGYDWLWLLPLTIVSCAVQYWKDAQLAPMMTHPGLGLRASSWGVSSQGASSWAVKGCRVIWSWHCCSGSSLLTCNYGLIKLFIDTRGMQACLDENNGILEQCRSRMLKLETPKSDNCQQQGYKKPTQHKGRRESYHSNNSNARTLCRSQ